MSRVYEALRTAEREVHSEIKAARGESNWEVAHPAQPGGEKDKDRDSEEVRKAVAPLQERFNIMAARFEDSRGYLEALIADARRMRDSLEAEVQKSRQIIQDFDLEALRAAGKRIQAELGKDLECLAQSIFERAEKRLEEKTTAALERLDRAVESRLANASTSAHDALHGRIEEESYEKLRQGAENVTKLAAQAMRKQAIDALEMFNQGLIACSGRILAESQQQLESAQATLRSIMQEAEGALRPPGRTQPDDGSAGQ